MQLLYYCTMLFLLKLYFADYSGVYTLWSHQLSKCNTLSILSISRYVCMYVYVYVWGQDVTL